LNGDVLTDGASEVCEILGSIVNFQSRTTYGDPNLPVIVRGYSSVTVGGDILTHHASNKYSDNSAGDIQIAEIEAQRT
jgi:hypothetical protein